MDWSGDGDLDILVGGRDGMIDYYQATDNADTYPSLHFVGHLTAGGSTIDVGYNAAPVVVDWNEDGLLDLVVGSQGDYYGNAPSIRLYLNSGTPGNPQLTGFSYLEADGKTINLYRVVPDVEDCNGDGKKDVVAGYQDGYVYYYENTGTNSSPVLAAGAWLTYNSGSSYIDPGYAARPYMIDWDMDGHLDMLCGAYDGFVRIYWGYETGVADESSAEIGSSGLTVLENPCSGTLSLELGLAAAQQVTLLLFSVDGRLVQTLDGGFLQAGQHLLTTDLSSLPVGSYRAVCTLGQQTVSRTIALIR
ncbi:VCBS repeat-containing protein [Candidatus Fermentibacterales bacterium]|nr:VCBS repeat-containing protein [Candidatus Fermentibacterales bacterium]